MKIEVDISDEDYEVMQSTLRPDIPAEDGRKEIPGLTVEQWLQAALNGKVHNCKKRNG